MVSSHRYQASTSLGDTDSPAASEPLGGVFDLAVVGMALVTRLTHRFHRLNPALQALLGRTEPALLGYPLTTVVHDDDRASVGALLRRSDAGIRRSSPAEARLIRDDGSQLRVTLTVTPAPATDSGLEFLLCQVSDVDEQRRAERDLRLADRLLATALEATTDAVYMKDAGGRYLMLNRAAASYFGCPASEVVGHADTEFFVPQEAAALMAVDRRVLASGVTTTTEEVISTDEGPRLFQSTKGIYRDDAGRPAGIFGISRDVTEQRRVDDEHRRFEEAAEEALRRASIELERRNSELEGFAAMVAHDLRQPLQVVGGFAQLLAERSVGSTDEPSGRYLAAIERGIGKMTAMVDSMLEYARAGEAEAPASLTDSHGIVADLIDGLEGSMNGGQVLIRGQLPVLPADPAQLSRLFENLIGNALKFRADTPPIVQIAAEKRDCNFWRFTVQDNGQGVSPDFADQLFGMFARERRSDQPGTGMGLAICRKIVEHHGGRIWFEPAPGHGSIFSFTLPAGPAA